MYSADKLNRHAIHGPMLLLAALLVHPPLGMAEAPATSKTRPQTAPAPTSAPVTVLPVLGFAQGAAVAADLTGVLFAELRAANIPDVRIRKPVQPLAISCITQLACLAQAGRAVQAERLLVGVVGSKDEGASLSLTLLLVSVPPGSGNAIPLRSASRALDPASPLSRAPLQALVAELAPYAGSPARSSSAPSTTTDASLLERIDQVSPVASPDASPVASPVVSPSVSPGSASSSPSSPAQAPAPAPVPGPLVARGQKLIQVWEEQQRQARESREREENARQEAQQREKRNREEARAAEAQRRLELQEARRKADADLKHKEALEKNRLENQERLRKGLPPLPPPAPPTEPTRSAQGAAAKPESPSAGPVSSKSPDPVGAKSSAGGKQAHLPGRSEPAAKADPISGVTRSSKPADVFLEGEGRWIFQASAHGASLAGFGLVGAALELAYQPIPHVQELWTFAGYRSLHGFDVGAQQWFYLHSAQAGALWRAGSERIHPLAGAQLETTLLADDVLGLGVCARGGMDLMVLDNLGVRLDLALGGLYGFGLSERLNYPSNGQLLFRAAVGTAFRF